MLRLALAALVIATLVVPHSVAARYKRQASVCQHGKSYMDECDNECNCLSNGEYGCTRKACENPGDAGVPKSCDSTYETQVIHNKRLFCKDGIVQFVSDSEPEKCDPGTSWKDDCNTCNCAPNGNFAACTLKACMASGAIVFDTSEEAELEFGDVTVDSNAACPNGLVEGPIQGQLKICRAKGCTADTKYTLNDGCTKCVCMEDGQPACGPCLRKPTDSTPLCGSYPRCPSDCSKDFSPKKNCFECCKFYGEIGFPIYQDQKCPEGTDVSGHGLVSKKCAPFHLLPQGDTRICNPEVSRCPQDCKLVRHGENEKCIFCQCGPKAKPTPCKPGERRTIDCNTCVCLESGYTACTQNQCHESYDQVVCGAEQCPEDSPHLVDKEDECLLCSKKRPSAEEQTHEPQPEIRVPKDQECPEGMVQVREDFNTIICAEAPTPPSMI